MLRVQLLSEIFFPGKLLWRHIIYSSIYFMFLALNRPFSWNTWKQCAPSCGAEHTRLINIKWDCSDIQKITRNYDTIQLGGMVTWAVASATFGLSANNTSCHHGRVQSQRNTVLDQNARHQRTGFSLWYLFKHTQI